MYYKDPQNNIHSLDSAEYAHLLPTGCVSITEEEAEQIRIANAPYVDPKDAIRAEISDLESTSLLPRVTREFMLTMTAATFAAQGADPMTNFGYVKVKELDDQITALRIQL